MVRWGGYFFWRQETAFSVRDHVGTRQLRPDDQFDALQLELIRRPLLPDKSPWEALLLVSEDGPGAHHVLPDGYSIIHALLGIITKRRPSIPSPEEPSHVALPRSGRIGALYNDEEPQTSMVNARGWRAGDEGAHRHHLTTGV